MSNKVLSANQEAFCKFLVAGDKLEDAFVKAGYSGNGCESNARKLKKQPHIAARIEELQALVAQGQKFELPKTAERNGAPYTSPFDANAAPNFSNPDIAWFRREIYDTMIAARDHNDFKAANEAAAMFFKTMYTPDVPVAKNGRPKSVVNNPNKGDEDANNDKPERAINVQIFNQVAQRLDRASRDEPAQEIEPAEDAPAPPERHLPDLRPGAAAFSIDGSSGDVREGVSGEAETSSADEPIVLRRVHDA